MNITVDADEVTGQIFFCEQIMDVGDLEVSVAAGSRSPIVRVGDRLYLVPMFGIVSAIIDADREEREAKWSTE